jgi:hypothetical protein
VLKLNGNKIRFTEVKSRFDSTILHLKFVTSGKKAAKACLKYFTNLKSDTYGSA